MFGGSRRHRPPVQPLTKETANPNAATAAASAFMRRDPPASNLSSAAAAAALKARPTTPINVAEVQTKRAQRRSASVSSTGSRDGGRLELRRTPSNGSMTERTFRSPSPGGRSPAHVSSRSEDIPPVPSLPRNGQVPKQSTHRATSSLSTQPFQTASQKARNGNTGSWYGAATAGDLSNVRTSDSVLQNVNQESEPRPGSISPSINFSYPRARGESPAMAMAPAPEPAMVYDPNSRRMVAIVPPVDLINRQQQVQAAADKPVKKKKKSKVSRSGSHLTRGTVGRSQGAAVDSSIGSQNIAPQPQTIAPAPKAVMRTVSSTSTQLPEELTDEERIIASPRETPFSQPGQQDTLVEHRTGDARPAQLDVRAADGATVLPSSDASHVSILGQPPAEESESDEDEDTEEETEDEETEDDMEPSRPINHIDAVPVRSTQAAIVPAHKAREAEDVATAAKQPGRPQTGLVDANRKTGNLRRSRVHSESPVRSAHFAPATDQLMVRHEPPPRSLSPRKSALKHSSSARGVSPSGSSEASGVNFRDEEALGKKKSARVSFNDDRNMVVGESTETPERDSPITPSPQTKKPWHSIISRNKRDSSPLDQDETMTPRPALPLFGSVREKKAKEPDAERPLIRPSERVWPSQPSNSSPQPDTSADVGNSADAAVGTVLAQDLAAKNEANTSRFREPLPPVVTSVDSHDYMNSSSESSDDEDAGLHSRSLTQESTELTEPFSEPSQNDELFKGTTTTEHTNGSTFVDSIADKIPETVREEPEKVENGNLNVNGLTNARADQLPTEARGPVPSIAIINPSPGIRGELQTSPEKEYFDATGNIDAPASPPAPSSATYFVPGGFPDEDEAAPSPTFIRPVGFIVQERTVEPIVAVEDQSIPAPQHTSGIHMDDIKEEDYESAGGSSIYSDAYEDLSDVDEEGFMSLDAVLSGTMNAKANQKLIEKTLDDKERRSTELSQAQAGDLQSGLLVTNDWDNAKAYWRSLSSDKRRQLEKEAREEAGDEADQEAVAKPKKPKKKKKRKSVEPPATIVEAPVGDSSRHSERNYQIQPGTAWTDEARQAASPKAMAAPKAKAPSSTAVAAPKLRKSMRESTTTAQPQPAAGLAAGSMRTTLRSNGNAGDAATRTTAPRPVSYHPPTPAEQARASRRTMSVDARPMSSAGVPNASIKPSLRRRGSDSSESSFVRVRNNNEGFGFKRSMRSSVQEPESPTVIGSNRGSGRFSLRSLSPQGSAFRRPIGAPPVPTVPSSMDSRMKTSLRNGPSEPPASASRLRSPFGRSSGKKAKPSKSGSRFGDSSDEETAGPSLFRSRFAESSDEEDTPRRPQSSGGGLASKSMRSGTKTSSAASAAAAASRVGTTRPSHSPDLPDSDDDIFQPKRATIANGQLSGVSGGDPSLRRTRSGRGTLITTPPPGQVSTQGVAEPQRPGHARRGSFMSNILRRKKDDGSKITRDTNESAARRDTRLERSPEQLSGIRSNSGTFANGNAPPRLQKRQPSWPLPEPDNNGPQVSNGTPQRPATSAGIGTPQRPSTSAGIGASAQKPSFLQRRSTSHQGQSILPAAQVPPPPMSDIGYEGSTATKKKKFGTLRRMFRIGD